MSCYLYFQVSTYALLVEDVLEVVSDSVVVHEAAASQIQRLTKVRFLMILSHLSCSLIGSNAN